MNLPNHIVFLKRIFLNTILKSQPYRKKRLIFLFHIEKYGTGMLLKIIKIILNSHNIYGY